MAKSKSPDQSVQQVDQFLKELDHPLLPLVEVLRGQIMNAMPALTEHIKWNAPSFCYNGDDRITFNLHKKDVVLIIFHRGAKTKDRIDSATLIRDTSGMLKWQSADRAVASFRTMEDVEQNHAWLQHIVEEWINATDPA